MNIAIIPARAGSQRVTNKNIRPFNGKPIIAYSIEAALQSQLFDDVVVSTDSEKIANIAKQYGANVPWLRPKDIADHHTPTLPVIQHAINLYEAQNNVTIDTVCCVYAAAPFVTSELLLKAYDQLLKSNVSYCLPVCEFDYPIHRALRLDDKRNICMADSSNMNSRSQDLPVMYHDVGQFYMGVKQAWLKGEAILGESAQGIIIPRSHALDIDTEDDWDIAEIMHKQFLL
ncbi:MAG: pseudaminic acid cytidylyltransferase [Bermanella sp.]|jgi:pseudaminic acid cytidylyltransferase